VLGLRLPDEEATLLGAFELRREHALRPSEPAACDRLPGLEAVVVVEEHREPSGVASLPCHLVQGVGTLTGGDALVEPAHPPGGVGEHLERAGISRGDVEPCLTQQLVRGRPVAAG